MAKKGMRRPDVKEPHGTESNKKQYQTQHDVMVPEIKGKVKNRNSDADQLF